MQAVHVHPTLNSLHFYDITHLKQEIRFVSKLLASKPAIITLILENCSIGDEGVTDLVMGLKHNFTLSTLGLKKNMITDVGAKALFTHLSTSSSLVNVFLEDNPIGSASKRTICNALRLNSSLEALWMDKSLLTRESDGPELLAALEHHPSLTSVCFFRDMMPVSYSEIARSENITARNIFNNERRNLNLFYALLTSLEKDLV
jgi:Ran GTPase-activating protein (RanGAP) involved in mRNA processing and transport